MNMIDLSQVKHHPAIEEIAQVICNKTQNDDRGFFDVEVAFFLWKMASSMRATVLTQAWGELPINGYVMAFGPSGTGKGYSISTLEDDICGGFRDVFMNETFPAQAEDQLWKMAIEKAARNGTEEQEEKDKLDKEFYNLGAYAFTFDSGTAPAIKQMRQKLLMAHCGAINFQADEIGSNLTKTEIMEVLTLFLELYDQGKTKQKLTKNTAENWRGEELQGKTPANALLFGTPSKLLDGGPTEAAFFDLLETGYARRSLFGIGNRVRASLNATPEEIYDRLTDPNANAIVDKWFSHFHNLANRNNYGKQIIVDREVGIAVQAYKIECEAVADALPEHEEIRKSELTHRYFKALKLAGAYAFCDMSAEVDLDHLYSAIKLVEQSGECFTQIFKRDRSYVKLAKYLGSTNEELTHADLIEALPFYPASGQRRKDLLALASSWGIKNNVVIRTQWLEGIEFIRGETLEKTDLDHLMCSYSNHLASGYYAESHMPFIRLHELASLKDMHWANHHFRGGHRSRDNVIPGFNCIVIDVDGTCPLAICHELLSDLTYFTHTTKRHQVAGDDYEAADRYRIVIPMSHKLYMDTEEYKEFMNNVMAWLPFEVDPSCNEPEKKWLTHEGCQYHYNEAELLDILQFIPKTSKNEAFRERYEAISSLDHLERWFIERMQQTGNRNNNFIKYALALCDAGCDYNTVEANVLALNQQLPKPLSEDELRSTVLVTVAKKLADQEP